MRAPITGISQALVEALPAPTSFKFEPKGFVACALSAIGESYSVQIPTSEPTTNSGPVSVVRVGMGGPLMHHPQPYVDSYDSIKERVRAALSTQASCVLLSIDSPGGLVAGCLDTVEELRALALQAGKPLFGYVDSMACSAAYALLGACQWIFIPRTGLVGSVGIIEELRDCTQADAALGLKYTVVTSGIRKADSNPHMGKSPEVVAAFQSEVDSLAEEFFACVSTYRALSIDQVRSLQAAVYHGEKAIEVGLADQIATEDEVIALLSTGTFKASRAASLTGESMATFAEAMSVLQGIVDDEKSDPDQKEKARKMIAACNTAPKAEEEKPKEEAVKAEKEPDGDEPEKKDEKEPDQEPEGKKAIHQLRTEVIDLKRTALLATRGDFTPAQLATLKRAPLSVVQDAVDNWPRATTLNTGAVSGALAALGAHSTLQPDTEDRKALSAYEQATLERLRPSLPDKPYTDLDGFRRVPACTPQKQKELLDRLEGRKA